MTNSGAVYTTKDVTITGCVVAGPCPDVEFAYAPSTMEGMKIEAIVVFPDALTLAQISECQFPVGSCSVEVSDAGSYAWADLPWHNGNVPVGDAGSNAVSIACNASVTITDASLVVTAATVRCTGTGTLTFVGDVEFATKGGAAIEMNLATSGDGALTLADGDWYLGRQVAGYKNFTITGSNPLTLEADATLVVYNGRVGSPVAGCGTIRSVDLLPRANELDVALTNAVLWHGNCVLEEIDNVTFAVLNPDSYGNETSKLTFNGVTNKYFKFIYPVVTEANTPAFNPELAIKSHSKTGGVGLGIRGGATGGIAKIKKLSGDGALVNVGDGSDANHMLLVQDWESFTGSVEVNSKMRIFFGATATGSGVSGNGIVLVRSGAPLSLDANSKIHGWLDNDAGSTIVQGTLEVVSGKSLCGGCVSVASTGELVFDADKAQAVSDSTLTDCSEEDMSKITGSGLVRFKGSYSPFVLPDAAARNLNSSMAVRLDGATVNGDLSVASRFGGSGTFGGGTLSILDGATLDLTWGTLAIADAASVAAPPSAFTVVAEAFSDSGDVKLFTASAIPESWCGILVSVASPDGSNVRHCRTVIRADGLYAVRNGLSITIR